MTHFLIYRLEGEIVVVSRVLDDVMELARHLAPQQPLAISYGTAFYL